MNKYIIIALVCFLTFFIVQNKLNKDKLDTLMLENRTLSDQLQASISINNGKVTILYRDREKIKYVDRYLPPEGDGTINIGTDGTIEVNVKDKGFTFLPQLGLGVASSVHPQVAARLAYWNRYGLGLGLSSDGVNLFFDRRVDDFIPFMNNSTIGVYIDRNNTGLKLSTFF